MKLAPIVLFVYNRLWHTQQTVESLKKNELADKSELFIYSDAAKNEEAIQNVENVRHYIKQITGFKKITIIERDKNCGLANSIIDGVTSIINQYEKVIVLEDDLVTSPYFLKFMNDALDFYMDEEKIWHISGWNHPIDTTGLNDVFLWRFMCCWGWATWKNRWQYFEKDTDKLIREFSKNDIWRFNLDGGEDFWSHVIANKKGILNTWAIYWYANIFKKNGLCVNPSITLVSNIGLDGSGTNSYNCDSFKVSINNEFFKYSFNEEITENILALNRTRDFFIKNKVPFFNRVSRRLIKVFYMLKTLYS
jgi:hypothetical protein